ncbi:MAG: outer membrane beta-barrel protein [Xanthobacteraceae bacterium]
MRWVFCALVVLWLPSPAAAEDFDILRGSQPVGPATFTRWSGFYAGGQIGVSTASADFSNSTQPLVAYALRETLLEENVIPSQWPVLGATNASAASYGGFVGYNTQWQDLIVGMEANFNRASLNLRAPVSSIGRSVSDGSGSAYALNMTGSGSLVAEDFATVRLRGGWVAGNFLPYGFIGVAFGIANTAVSATAFGVQYTSGTVGVCASATPCYPFNLTNGFSANNQVLYGFTVGGGVDVALTANIFLRAEFEWDQFNPPPGFLATIATGRLGAGVKF